MNTMNTMNAWIGIDISKATFDACLLRQQSKPIFKAFSNDRQGFTQLLAWARSHTAGADLHFCLEATGAYGEALACFLAQAQQKVSVINPARIRFAGLSRGTGNKTDPADARLIADYCRKENPPPWRAAAPEVRELVALLRRLHSLHTMVQQEKNRSAEPHLTTGVRNSVEETLQFLNQQIAALQRQIRQLVDRHPELRRDRDLLVSIPGIGEATALWIVAELRDVAQFASASSAAAYAGLAPRQHRSGTSVHKRSHLSKAGNRNLRRALYMPAVTACRWNPLIKTFYERLLARGLTRKAAVGAAMRKLLMIAFGALKNQCPFAATPSTVSA